MAATSAPMISENASTPPLPKVPAMVGQLDTGMVLEPAVAYQRVARTKGVPRHSH